MIGTSLESNIPPSLVFRLSINIIDRNLINFKRCHAASLTPEGGAFSAWLDDNWIDNHPNLTEEEWHDMRWTG